MYKLLFMTVLLVVSLSFGFVAYDAGLPEVNVDYPKAVNISGLERLNINDILTIKVKVDPIGGNVVHMIPESIATKFNKIDNAQDAVSAAFDFARTYPSLIGVSPENLSYQRSEKIRKFWYVTLDQHYNGTSVIGGNAEFRINDKGEVFFYHSGIKPMDKPLVSETISKSKALDHAIEFLGVSDYELRESHIRIGAIPNGKKYEGKYVWWLKIMINKPLALYIIWVDAQTGEVLRALNELPTLSGKVEIQYHPEFSDDTMQVGNMKYAFLQVNGTGAYTDSFGNYSVAGSTPPFNFHPKLYGNYCEVTRNSTNPSSNMDTTVTGPIYDHLWCTPPAIENEINMYYHVNVVHDFVKNYLGYSSMDYRVKGNVSDSRIRDNAFSDGVNINFGVPNRYNDLSMHADVVYHEYQHLVTGRIYSGVSFPYSGESGAINEALSDYFPCSFLNDPLMGNRVNPSAPSYYMRNLNNGLMYPTDIVGEVHYDSRIISAVWWQIRTALGIGYTDSLVHRTRFGHPVNFEEYLDEMLVADDDDGDLSNGTPNSEAIFLAYNNHGIGPEKLMAITHRCIGDQEDTTGEYFVSAKIFTVLEIDSTAFCYYVNSPPWSCTTLTYTGSTWVANIPAQQLNSRVYYHFYIKAPSGFDVKEPPGAGSFSFRVRKDTIPPIVNHTPIVNASLSIWPPEVVAQATDNGSVRGVTLEYSINGTLQLAIPFSYDYYEDIWITNFPTTFPSINDTIDYRIIATDNSAAANVGFAPDSISMFRFIVTLSFFEDVETGAPGWRDYSVTSTYTNQWHVSTARKLSGSHSFKCGGTGHADYADGLDAGLMTPVIFVSDEDTLFFYYWIDAENDDTRPGYAWDGGIVEVNLVGTEEWRQLDPIGHYPYRTRSNLASPFAANTPCYSGTQDWNLAVFPLDFLGYVKFRFRFGSDAHITGEGWYIDDIRTTNWTFGPWIEEQITHHPQSINIDITPNPFNSSVSFSILVPEDGLISVVVMDIVGKHNYTVYKGEVNAGILGLTWQPSDIPAGIYLVRVRNNDYETVKKIYYIK